MTKKHLTSKLPIYDQYAADVRAGRIVVCEYTKQAVDRYVSMRNDKRFKFRKSKVTAVIDFFAFLKHYKGSHAGEPFLLEPWQQWIIASVYGLYWRDSGKRVVKEVYLEVSRKQGKSALAAGLCLYHLVADGEMSAEVYLAANSKDQANIAFEMCDKFAKTIDPKKEVLTRFRSEIRLDENSSKLKCLASDDSKLDGFNACMFLMDEYHAAKNNLLYGVLESSQGMRDQPMRIVITTAGFDKMSPCYTYRTVVTEIVAGLKKDDKIFGAIYTLDDGDDWKDEKVWKKCAPNLGVTVGYDYLRDQVVTATNDKSKEVGIKTKNFNVWCDSEMVWIPSKYINAATRNIGIEEFRGRTIYAGIDLASTSDLTCVTFMCFNDEDKPIFKTFYFLPQAALTEKRHKILYGEWARQGHLVITQGNVTDYDYILNHIMEFSKVGNIAKIAYDSWNSTQFVIKATDLGLPMEPYSQAIGNFNKPTKEFERLILSNGAILDNNPITRFCFANVQLKTDWNGNAKPNKQFDDKKIDGVIPILESLGVWMENPVVYSNSI